LAKLVFWVNFVIKEFNFSKLLSFESRLFATVSLVRGNLIRLREYLKHKIRTPVTGKSQGITWLQPSTLYFKLSLLSMSDFTELGGSLEANACKVRLSRPQWLLLLHLYSTWSGSINQELNEYLLQDAMTRKLPSLVSNFKGFHVSGQKTKSSVTLQAHCQEASVGLGNIPASVIPLLDTSKGTIHTLRKPRTS
jgi:hypothetical protein